MKREEVRDLIQSAINGLSERVSFNSGRITEFNSERENDYPFAWLESLSRETSFNNFQMPMDDWGCVMHFVKLDQPGSPPEDYERLVDECDLLSKKFIYQLNQVITGFNLVTLSGLGSEPKIQKHADRTTGVILSFTLNIPDTTDVC